MSSQRQRHASAPRCTRDTGSSDTPWGPASRRDAIPPHAPRASDALVTALAGLDGPGCAQPSATTTTAHAELTALLGQHRLSPEEIRRARSAASDLPFAQQAVVMHALQEKVIYRNQRNNQHPAEVLSGGTCNVTAATMALDAVGAPHQAGDEQPEDAMAHAIERNGGDLTTASAWEDYANQLEHGAEIADETLPTHDAAWWRETVRDQWLASGAGVVVSLNGHVVRIQAITEEGVVVDDPYGESTLHPSEDRPYSMGRVNGTEQDGSSPDNHGEDHVWPWEDVLHYTFKYFFITR